jgi:hypothetical protein
MRYGFSLSPLVLTIFLVATPTSFVRLGTPAQNTAPKDQAKVPTGSTFEGEIMDNNCAEMGSHAMTMTATALSTPDLCTTYCLRFTKTPGKLVLYNAATKLIYQLDNQQEASFFKARKVKVIGTYDQATKTIHITDINSVSAS